MRLIEITFGPEKNSFSLKLSYVPQHKGWFHRFSRYEFFPGRWSLLVRAWFLDLFVSRKG